MGLQLYFFSKIFFKVILIEKSNKKTLIKNSLIKPAIKSNVTIQIIPLTTTKKQ